MLSTPPPAPTEMLQRCVINAYEGIIYAINKVEVHQHMHVDAP